MTTPSVISSHQWETAKVSSVVELNFATVNPGPGTMAVLTIANDGAAPSSSYLRQNGTSVSWPFRLESDTGAVGGSANLKAQTYSISSQSFQFWTTTVQSNTSLTDVISSIDGMCMSSNGLYMYVNDRGAPRKVHQFSFTTAFDISTLSYDGAFTFVPVDGYGAYGGYMAEDGSAFFLGTNSTGTNIYQYDLTTSYDLLGGTTLSTLNTSGTLYGVWFSPDDPYTLYFILSINIFAQDLTVAYDITSTTGGSYTVSKGQITVSSGSDVMPPKFSPDGTVISIGGFMYKLTTAYDLSTSVKLGTAIDTCTILGNKKSGIRVYDTTNFYEKEFDGTNTVSFDLIINHGGTEEFAIAVSFIKDVLYDTLNMSMTFGNSNTAVSNTYTNLTDSMRWLMAAWDSSQFPHTATSPLAIETTGQTTGGGSGSVALTTAYALDETAETTYSIVANGSDDWGAVLLELEGLISDPSVQITFYSTLPLYSNILTSAIEASNAHLIAKAEVTRCVGTAVPHNFGRCHCIADEFKVRAPRPLRVTNYAFEQIVDESTNDFIGGINEPIVIRDADFGINSDKNRIAQNDHNIFVCRVRFLIKNITTDPVTFKPYNLINIPNKMGRHCLPPEQSYINAHVRTYQDLPDNVSGISTTSLMEFVQPTLWENEFTSIGPYMLKSVYDGLYYTAYKSVNDGEATFIYRHDLYAGDAGDYRHKIKYNSTNKQYEAQNTYAPDIGTMLPVHRISGMFNSPVANVINNYKYSNDDFETGNNASVTNDINRAIYWNNRYWYILFKEADPDYVRVYEAINVDTTPSLVFKFNLGYDYGKSPSSSSFYHPDNLTIEVNPSDTDSLYILIILLSYGEEALIDRVYQFTTLKYSITANTLVVIKEDNLPLTMAIGDPGDHPYDGQILNFINSHFVDNELHFSSEITSSGQMYGEYVININTLESYLNCKEVSAAAIFGQLNTSHYPLNVANPDSIITNRFEENFPVNVKVPYGFNVFNMQSFDSAIFDKEGYVIPLTKPFVDKKAAYPVAFTNTPQQLHSNFISCAYDTVTDKIRILSITNNEGYSETEAHQSSWHSHNLTAKPTSQKIGTGTYTPVNLCRYDTGRCFDETTIPANSEVEISIPVYFMSDGYETTSVRSSLADSYVSIRDQGNLISTYRPARAMFSHREPYVISAKCNAIAQAIVLIKPLQYPYVLAKAKAIIYAKGKAKSYFRCRAIGRAIVNAEVMPEELIQLSWYAEKFGYDELFPVDLNNLNNDIGVNVSDLDSFHDIDFGNKGYGWGDVAARFRIHNNTDTEVTINPQLEIQVDDGSWVKTTYDTDTDQLASPPLFLSNHLKYPDDRDGYLLFEQEARTGFILVMVTYGATTTEYVFKFDNSVGTYYGKSVVFDRVTNTFGTVNFVGGSNFENVYPPYISSWISTTEKLICSTNNRMYKYNVSTRVLTDLGSPITVPTGTITGNIRSIKPVQTSTPNGNTYVLCSFGSSVVGTPNYNGFNIFGQYDTATDTVPSTSFVDLSVVGLDNLVARISNILKHPAYSDRFKIIIINNDATANIYIADLSLLNVVSSLTLIGSAASLGVTDTVGAGGPVLPGSWQDPDGYVHCGLGNTENTGAYVVYDVFTESLLFPNKRPDGTVFDLYLDDYLDWWGEGASHSEFLMIGHALYTGVQVLTKVNATDIHYTIDQPDDYSGAPYDNRTSTKLAWLKRFSAQSSGAYSSDAEVPYWDSSLNTFGMLAGYRTSITPKSARLRTLGIGQTNTHGEDTLQKISLGSNFVTANHANLAIWDFMGNVTVPSKSSIEITAQFAMHYKWFENNLTGAGNTAKHWVKVRFVDDNLAPITINQRKGDDYLTIWTLPGLSITGQASPKAIATVSAKGTKVAGDPGGGQASLIASATVSADGTVPSEFEGYSNFTLDFTVPNTSYIFTKGSGFMPMQMPFTMTNYHSVHRSGKISVIGKADVRAFVGVHIPRTCP